VSIPAIDGVPVRNFLYFILNEEHIMEALRKIMVAKELSTVMDIPTKPKVNVGLVKRLKGSLNKYANANLQALEKKAFELAVEENYKRGKYNVKNNS